MGQAAVTSPEPNKSSIRPGGPRFDRRVQNRLVGLGRRLRWYVLVGGLAAVAGAMLAAGAVQFTLDYTFRLPLDMRATLLGLILIVLLIVAWRRLWTPWRFPFGPREMASLVELRNPDLQSLLVSAVQFSAGEVGTAESNSPELMRAVVDRACDASATISFGGILQHRRARRSLATIVALISCVVLAFWWQPELMGTWLERNLLLMDTNWRQRTRLVVVDVPDGVLTGARGDDLEVRARADGEVPRQVVITFESDSGTAGRETMIAVGERGFRHTFTRVEEPLRFRLKGGDDETQWYRIQLADRPRIEQVSIRVTPPAYAGMDPFELPQGQLAVETLRGSRVTIDARLNKPVVRAVLMSGQQTVQPAGGADDAWTVSISPTETRTYHFALEDALDLTNKRPLRMSVRIIKDAAPRVRMKARGVSDIITTQALLPLEMTFSDTYGLARAALMHESSRSESQPTVLRLEDFKPGMTNFDARLRWSAATLPLIPGDRVSLFAEASDYNDVTGPGHARSGVIALRIVTNDELLAELARREQEYRQEFERVIEQQEDLRRKLLTLIGRLEDEDTQKNIASRVAPLERRQRQIAGQVNLLRQQFEQILAEFEVNGMDTATVRERLDEGVVRPLNRLVRRDLVSAADRLRRIERDPDPETAAAADAGQVAVLNEMREILSSMLKWEGFQEAVTMLREIVRLQQGLRDETLDEIERRAAEILGGD